LNVLAEIFKKLEFTEFKNGGGAGKDFNKNYTSFAIRGDR
jgi:hypothetical protein